MIKKVKFKRPYKWGSNLLLSLKNFKNQKPLLPSSSSSLSSPLPLLSFSAYSSFEAPILLEFSITLSASLEALYLLFLPSTQISSAISLLHRQIWIGSRVKFLTSSARFNTTRASLAIVFPVNTSCNFFEHRRTGVWLALASE